MKIRNAKLGRAAHAACKGLDDISHPRAIANELLHIVYRSRRLRTLLERHAILDIFKNDVEGFKLRGAVHPDVTKQQRIAKYPTIRCMSGNELRIETLVAASSFKDVYRRARECLGLKPNADSRSLRLIYIGNRLPQKYSEWKYGDEIPCTDALVNRRLRGAIMQAIIHA